MSKPKIAETLINTSFNPIFRVYCSYIFSWTLSTRGRVIAFGGVHEGACPLWREQRNVVKWCQWLPLVAIHWRFSLSSKRDWEMCSQQAGNVYSHSVTSGVTFPFACYDSKNAKISTCNRRPFRLSISAHFVICKTLGERTYQRSWYISAHFVKAVKGKMLVTDCQKARMKSREWGSIRNDRREW